MFTKYPYEVRYRYFQFKRPDNLDGLAVGETLATVDSVTCLEVSSPYLDVTSDMIANFAIYLNTQVVYMLQGGLAGRTYMITIKATTSLGQKLEGVVYIKVIEEES